MLGRLSLFFALLVGIAATQMPEFLQQYRQRLGGAIDELATVVARFDASVAREGLDQATGVARLKDSPDPLVKREGEAKGDEIARLHRLQTQQLQIDGAGPIGRYVKFAADFDPRVAARAYAIYQPAVPVTTEAFLIGTIGFVVGGGVFRLMHWPFRAVRRRRAAETGQAARA